MSQNGLDLIGPVRGSSQARVPGWVTLRHAVTLPTCKSGEGYPPVGGPGQSAYPSASSGVKAFALGGVAGWFGVVWPGPLGGPYRDRGTVAYSGRSGTS